MKLKSPRTSFFQRAASLKPEFREHLDIAWDLTAKQRTTILRKLPDLWRAEVERTSRLARDDIVASVGGDAATTLKVVNVLEYLWGRWNARYDTADGTMRDVLALKVLPEDKKRAQIAKSFLRRFFQLAEKESPRVLTTESAGSILSNLTGVDVVVDFRAVERGEYAWTTDPVAKYRPELLGLVPVIVVSIRISKKESPIVFQCEGHEMESLVRKLQSSLKLLDAASRFTKK